MDATEDIAFLAASEHRTALLRTLYREGPLDKDALVDRTGAARVTVSRNLDSLAERDVIEEVEDGYALTLVGDPLVEDLLALADTAETVDRLRPFLRHVPSDSFDLQLDALSGADVTAASRANPYAPIERHTETLKEADHVRALLPATGAAALKQVEEYVLEGGVEAECVVSSAVATTMASPGFVETVSRMQETGNMRILRYDGEVPYYVGLVDGTVQLGIDDGDGVPRALVETDEQAAVKWAESTYEEYRKTAEPFTPANRG